MNSDASFDVVVLLEHNNVKNIHLLRIDLPGYVSFSYYDRGVSSSIDYFSLFIYSQSCRFVDHRMSFGFRSSRLFVGS